MKISVGLFFALILVADFWSEEVFGTTPLPVITAVDYNTRYSENVTVITAHYTCNDKPKVVWFVDGFAIAYPEQDFFQLNDFGQNGFTILSTTRDKGRRFSVCLIAANGQVCLKLRPLPNDETREETVACPWPLIVPAPIARYYEGNKARMSLPPMDTPHDYTYSAHFVGHDPQGRFVEGKSRDMEGGEEGDLVTIAPATFGEGGWMVYVNTDRASYEGVLIVSLTFRTQSGVAESCTVSRPINIYVRGHSGPFEQDFVAMVPQENDALPWQCRDGLGCVITCPFVANGPVNVELSRVSSEAHLISGAGRYFWGEEWRLGEYYGEARFLVTSFNSTLDADTYQCTVSTESRSATADVIVD